MYFNLLSVILGLLFLLQTGEYNHFETIIGDNFLKGTTFRKVLIIVALKSKLF